MEPIKVYGSPLRVADGERQLLDGVRIAQGRSHQFKRARDPAVLKLEFRKGENAQTRVAPEGRRLSEITCKTAVRSESRELRKKEKRYPNPKKKTAIPGIPIRRPAHEEGDVSRPSLRRRWRGGEAC
jgi:hypothetical protein